MSTGARRRMGVEERREQLIAVALELFGRHPPEEVSIDDIAAAAGISRPLVYHYFPGKRSLYGAAIRRAADELSARLVEPATGPFGRRLLRVVGRYFDFVAEHGPGFSALLRGGLVAGAETGAGSTGSVIDEVRRAARDQMLAHLGLSAAGPRLDLVLRSWVSLAETTALAWLDGGEPAREELELQLVRDFLALAAVTALSDPETARVVERILAGEPADGPFGELALRLAGPPRHGAGTDGAAG